MASPSSGGPGQPDGLDQPTGEWAGWQHYHEQMFDASQAANSWVAWKINSTGVNIARGLAKARNTARDQYVTEHGVLRSEWPLPHPPAVLWMPHYFYAACLGCYWVRGGERGEATAAATAARDHAREHVPAVEAVRELLSAPIRVSPRGGPYDPPVPLHEV